MGKKLIFNQEQIATLNKAIVLEYPELEKREIKPLLSKQKLDTMDAPFFGALKQEETPEKKRDEQRKKFLENFEKREEESIKKENNKEEPVKEDPTLDTVMRTNAEIVQKESESKKEESHDINSGEGGKKEGHDISSEKERKKEEHDISSEKEKKKKDTI